MTTSLDKTKPRYRNMMLHLLCWAVLIIVPVFFHSSDDPWPTVWNRYLRWLGTPLAYMVVFYINYLWLVPRFLLKKRDWKMFLLINVGVIALGLFTMDIWHVLSQNLLPELHNKVQSHPNKRPSRVPRYFWAVLTLSMFVALTVAVRMIQRWQHIEDARKEAEAARAEAELSNLRNQLNPHFLLNTLNNIYALTAFDPTKAQEAIQELSKLLRYILYDTQQSMVPLKDEVEFIENYVQLMRIRLPQSVDVNCQFSIGNSQLTIAPLLFISLVENAFKHGVSPTEPSFIHISIEADEQQMICDIQNSNHPKAANDHSGHGIGLQQVQRRLDLAYPGRYTWQRHISDDGKIYQSKITLT